MAALLPYKRQQRSHTPPKVKPSPFSKQDDSEDTPEERAQLMGEILAGLFGDTLLAPFATGEKSLELYFVKSAIPGVSGRIPGVHPEASDTTHSVGGIPQPPKVGKSPKGASPKPPKMPQRERDKPFRGPSGRCMVMRTGAKRPVPSTGCDPIPGQEKPKKPEKPKKLTSEEAHNQIQDALKNTPEGERPAKVTDILSGVTVKGLHELKKLLNIGGRGGVGGGRKAELAKKIADRIMGSTLGQEPAPKEEKKEPEPPKVEPGAEEARPPTEQERPRPPGPDIDLEEEVAKAESEQPKYHLPEDEMIEIGEDDLVEPEEENKPQLGEDEIRDKLFDVFKIDKDVESPYQKMVLRYANTRELAEQLGVPEEQVKKVIEGELEKVNDALAAQEEEEENKREKARQERREAREKPRRDAIESIKSLLTNDAEGKRLVESFINDMKQGDIGALNQLKKEVEEEDTAIGKLVDENDDESKNAEIDARLEKHVPRLTAYEEQKEVHINKIRAEFKLRFDLDNPAKLNFTTRGFHGNDTAMKNLKSARRFLKGLISTDIDGEVIELEARLMKPNPKLPYGGVRAHYSNGRINMTPFNDASVHAHEIGHHFNENPKVKSLCLKFLLHRKGGEKSSKLNQVFPGIGYQDYEEGFKDDFEKLFGKGSSAAYYAGKYYMGGQTELISLGVEKLYSDPLAFAEADPEYFQLVTGVLSGRLLTGAEPTDDEINSLYNELQREQENEDEDDLEIQL